MFPNPPCNFQQAVSWAVWGRTKEQLHSLALKIIINTRYQVQNFSRLKKTLSMACFFLILVQKNHVLNYSTIHL